METDWAENRADIPQRFPAQHDRQVSRRLLHHVQAREIPRRASSAGAEPGTVEIYISHRVMEQVPTARSTTPAHGPASRGACCRPIPDSKRNSGAAHDAFRHPRGAGDADRRHRTGDPAPDRAQLEKTATATSQLVLDDSFDRAWRRVGLALDRTGFTVVDRDRSKGLYFVRYRRSRRRSRKRKRACSRSSCSGRAHDREARAIPDHRRGGDPRTAS